MSEAGPSAVKRENAALEEPEVLREEDLFRMLEESDFSDCDDVDIKESLLFKEESSSDEEDPSLDVADDVWSNTFTPMKDIEFRKTPGLLIDVPEDASPYQYFRLLLDDDLLQLITTETNRYAENLFFSNISLEHARVTRWKNLTNKELLQFIGLLFHMGTIKCNVLKDYWKTHRLFGIPSFTQYMSRDRFHLTLQCLHFAENPSEGEKTPTDRLYKIRPILDYFQNKMSSIYYPNKNLSLDESMLLWRGSLAFRQYYIKNKEHKYGIKLYMLAECEGLVMNVMVYTDQSDETGGHAEKVVMTLMRNYLNAGHSVFMDSLYNSYGLAKKLLDADTYCTGTLRATRKGAPKTILSKKLQKGQTVAAYRDGVMVGKWKDYTEVLYISTEFRNSIVDVPKKRGNPKEKPLPIAEYNKFMSVVDRMDQMMSYYPTIQKTLRWYKKLGIHIFQLLLFNSYLLYNKYSKNRLSFYKFRLAVLEEILPEVRKTKPSDQNPINHEGNHFPEKIGTRNEGGKIMRKRCKVCWMKRIRRDCSYHCPKCPDAPGLCIGQCFEQYHKN